MEWARLKSWFDGAKERILVTWALVCATIRVAIRDLKKAIRIDIRVFDGGDDVVHKVVAVDEERGLDATVTKAFKLKKWEESVRKATGWRDQQVIRADVRYVAHGKKYRMVLRPGDECPLIKEVPERHRGGPRGVLAAELVGDKDKVDVTRRVLKYQGPGKDFHASYGLRVAVADMFPKDDIMELMRQFHTLRIIDAQAGVVRVSMTCSDVGLALECLRQKR